MAPKGKAKDSSKKGKGTAQGAPDFPTVDRPNILDNLFPAWDEAAVNTDKPDAKSAEKFADHQGLLLPDDIRPFLDTWKRPEDLVLGQPEIPIVSLADVEVNGKPVPGGPNKRAIQGKLFAGNRKFDWLWHVIASVKDLEVHMEPGSYLWENIFPQNKDKLPEKRPDGKFYVRLFVMDKWRQVVVDDRMPVDLFGTPLPVGMRPLQLWPLVLCKAVMKVMAAYKILDMALPDQVPAFEWLTGWPQENLCDTHSGVEFVGGELFDRIEASVQPYPNPKERQIMTTCCLVNRAQPERPPPRIIVLYGPSGVGVGRILDTIVKENAMTLDRTISTTTRFPKEHEVEGKDYNFTDLAILRAAMDANEYLETAYVIGNTGRYMYGSSLATVRTVAATGKLCCMSMDPQGIKLVQKTPGVDGLYIYVAPPSMEELEVRCRGRLKESESTISKRLQWAESQVQLSGEKTGAAKNPTPIVDFVIDNTNNEEVYDELKEAISSLSPIIRNRLRGLPAYVLAYSDLIPSNSVEKPFLKPVIIAGPSCSEKTELMKMLIKEFPDVFAFAQLTTTQKDDEYDYRVPDDFDMRSYYSIKARSQAGSRAGSKAGSKSGSNARKLILAGGKPLAPLANIAEEREVSEAGESDGPELPDIPFELEPRRRVVTDEEFDAMVAGGEFIEHHKDLFKHEKSVRKWGTTKADSQDVIADKKLVLMDCDMEGLKLVRGSGQDCLTIFLNPTSIQEFERRLRAWLSYTDPEINVMIERAREAEAFYKSSGLFDYKLINKNLDKTVDELKNLISSNRPDLIPPKSKEEVKRVPYLVVSGARAWGHKDLVARMVTDMAESVKVAVSYAVRKAREGEEDGVHYRFLGKPDAFKKMQDKGELLESVQIGSDKEAAFFGVPRADVEEGKAAGKIIAMKVNTDGAKALRANTEVCGRASSPIFIYVAPPSLDAARARLQEKYGLEGEALDTAMAELEKELEEARIPADDGGVFDIVIANESTDVVYADIKMLLASSQPQLVKPPHKPLVVSGPFGTGKRLLLQRMIDEYMPNFGCPKVATTQPRSEDDPDSGKFITLAEADAEAQLAKGKFVTHENVLGKIYGIRSLEIRAVQGGGNICLVEVDSMAEVDQLKAAGLDANYVFVGPENVEATAQRMRDQTLKNPPLGYEPEEAANGVAARLNDEVAAARTSDAFDFTADMIEGDDEGSYARLLHAVSQCYPTVVPPKKVWGYGRQLWDPEVRTYGQKPIKVMVLGPAAVGKSAVCAELSEAFGVPWVDAGQLLQTEIKAKTPLGLRAKKYIDATKTVPDDVFIQLMQRELGNEACLRSGWILDGFPHSFGQISELQRVDIVPDKVIFLEGTHKTLMNRILFRKIDPATQKAYHVPNPEVKEQPLHEHIKPESKEVEGRLVIRHDDSEENVANRLKFWDKFYRELRRAYDAVSMTLSGEGDLTEIVQKCNQYLKVEDEHLIDITVTPSTDLAELQYQVLRTLKWRRKQLVLLRQHDGDSFWVTLEEMSSNASSIIVQGTTSLFTHHVPLVRPEPYSLQTDALFLVDSPEPIKVLTSLAAGPQSLVEDPVPDLPPPVPLILVGPVGVGKSTLKARLLETLPDKIVLPPLHTTRVPTEAEKEAGDSCGFIFKEEEEMGIMMDKDGFLYTDMTAEDEMIGLAKETVSVLAKQGKMAILEMETSEAREHKEEGMPGCYVFVTPSTIVELDIRLRDNRQLEEVDVQFILREAQAQMSSAAQEWDHVVVAGSSEARSLQALKQVLSLVWPKRPEPVPQHLFLKDYQWGQAVEAGPVQQRVQHVSANSAMLNLPRGRHLLQLQVDPDNVHAVSLRSNTPFKLAGFSEILKEAGAGIEVATEHVEGSYPAQEAGAFHLWFRQLVKLPEPPVEGPDDVRVGVVLNLGDVDMAPYCRLRLVDNDTLEDTLYLSGRIEPRRLKRNTNGYTLMAYSHLTRREPICGSPFRLSVSSSPGVSLETALSTRVEKFSDKYTMESRLIMSRIVMVSNSENALAVLFAEIKCSPQRSTGIVLQLLKAKGEKPEAVLWGQEEEEVHRWSAYDRIEVPVVALPPVTPDSLYVLQLSLDDGALPFTAKFAGELPETDIDWSLQAMPNVEEPQLLFVEDTSAERAAVAQVQKWNEQGPGGVKERPGRANNAAEARRLTKEAAAAAAAAERPPAPDGEEAAPAPKAPELPPKPTREVKWQEQPLVLDPAGHTRVVGTGEAPRLFGMEEWTGRVESIKTDIEKYKGEHVSKLKDYRKANKEQRDKLESNTASAVKEIRSSYLKSSRQLEKQRAALVKHEAEEARNRQPQQVTAGDGA